MSINLSPADNAGYANLLEFYADRLTLLDAQIWHFIAENQHDAVHAEPFRPSASLQDAPGLLTPQAMQATILRKARASLTAGVELPLLHLQRALGLNELETDLVVFALAAELDRKYSRIYGQMLGTADLSYPTLEIALRVLKFDAAQSLLAFKAFQTGSTLRKYVFCVDDNPARSIMHRTFRLDESVFHFLLRLEPQVDPAQVPIRVQFARQRPTPLLIGHEFQRTLRGFIANMKRSAYPQGLSVLRLIGPLGTGKTLHLVTALHELGVDLVSVRYDEAIAHGARASLRRLLREAVLRNACVAIWRVPTRGVDDDDAFWTVFSEEFTDFQGIVFITAVQQTPMGDLAAVATVYDVPLAIPALDERLLLWRVLLQSAVLADDVNLDELAEKFQLSPGQMVAAVQYADRHATWAGRTALGTADLHLACYRQLSTKLREKATLIEPRVGLADVVAPDAQLALLRQACDRIKFRSRVLDGWGFSQRLSYGVGVSMLFAGPPGTGKTMAAEALGHELGMPVYRIDLAHVVSKYIGETEKNLWEIFEEAKNSGSILFFDEADALFGKRTEVKDSHDKYANVETAFLLQKMEEFNGLSVLATNILQNIDEAFIRRFTYVIRFPFPDSAYREQIWRGMFPKLVPLGADVDIPFLAERFHIAGGLIKNIALGASYLAMAEQSDVQMRHILRAARDELNKTANLFRPEELGPYADLLS